MSGSDKVQPYQAATIDDGLPDWAAQARKDNKLYARAYYLTGNRDDAEDLIQDTYERVWKARGSDESIKNPSAFLGKAMNNRFLDWLRMRERRPRETKVDDLEPFDQACQGIEENLDLRDDEVCQALQALGVRQRHMIILVDIEGYSVKAAAAELRISYTTAHRNYQIARKNLGDALAHRDGIFKEGRHELE
ncbi:RNA polymerase sigma factor [Kitasatospora cineracea]